MKRYSFKPKAIPTIAALLVLPILLALGFWQLQRAEQKRQIEAEYRLHSEAKPLTLRDIAANPAQWRYFPVVVSGRFDTAHPILLDNKFYQHHIGYHVITPFMLSDGKGVLIDRGWIPLGASREKLPSIPTNTQPQTLRGMVTIPDANPFTLSNQTDDNDHWPLRIEQITIAQLAKATGHNLYPVIILLAPDQPDGFTRNWEPVMMKAYVHTGYAFQWFAMAAALVIIFIGVHLKKKP